jgi:MFS family permease
MWNINGPFIGWIVSSILLGLGFTFFSGAVEAWLVDAMHFAKYRGELEGVFGRGQMVSGAAMLVGSVAGGIIAQDSSLGVPYLMRAAILGIMFLVSYAVMRDLGFTPEKVGHPLKATKKVLITSLDHGLRKPPVRWVMLAAPFAAGVSFYVFYAAQPFLLQLYGNSQAYSIAGLAAAIVAGSQIVGGYLAPKIRKLFPRRTSALILAGVATAVILGFLGIAHNFYLALLLLVAWGMVYASVLPIRQAYLNAMIPSKQRATVLSFDSLMGSTGGVVIQPILGKAADVWSYSTSFIIGGAFELLAIPFLLKSRAVHDPADDQTAPNSPKP